MSGRFLKEMNSLNLILLLCLLRFGSLEEIPPDISTIKPIIAVAVVRPTNVNELNFFCDFTPLTGTDYLYTVEWGIITGLSWTHTLKEFNQVRYLSQFDFRNKTALTEQILKERNFGHLGFTIACSITAQHYTSGVFSSARESIPKFFGIEVLNKTVKVNNNEDATIFVRLTVPFGCAVMQHEICDIFVTVYIPKHIEGCKTTELSQIQGVRNRCGVKIRSDQINEWVPLRLTGELRMQEHSKFQLILNTIVIPIHPFFSYYFVDPIQVEVHTDMTRMEGTRCDVFYHHFSSFDGLKFEISQAVGTFILYRNTNYRTQVQMQSAWCDKNVLCNCGVAINAGRDVFIIDNCGNGILQKWRIKFSECKDRILRRKVFKINESTFEVILPTGTLVKITLTKHELVVIIQPGLSDYRSTEGLCGIFDHDLLNDQSGRPGSIELDWNLSWRVTLTEDLFDFRNDKYLRAWQDVVMLCSCNDLLSGPGIIETVACHTELSNVCEDDRSNPMRHHQCSLSARRKRSSRRKSFYRLS